MGEHLARRATSLAAPGMPAAAERQRKDAALPPEDRVAVALWMADNGAAHHDDFQRLPMKAQATYRKLARAATRATFDAVDFRQRVDDGWAAYVAAPGTGKAAITAALRAAFPEAV